MIEAEARAAKADEMVTAWTKVAMAWHAVDRCSRYHPENLTEAAQLAREMETCAVERDVEMVEHWFAKVRVFGHPE